MRKLIVKSLETIAYVAMALIIVGAGGAGAAASGGAMGFLLGAIAGAVLAVAFFGALFLLIDIADNTRRMANDATAGSSRDQELQS